MSKNLTRKGLAFGALVALTGSVLVSTPAHAAEAVVTGANLVPTTGQAFDSILQAGINLTASFEGTSQTGGTADSATDISFRVTNTDQAPISVEYVGTQTGATNVSGTDDVDTVVYNGDDAVNGTAISSATALAIAGDAASAGVKVFSTKKQSLIITPEATDNIGTFSGTGLIIKTTETTSNVTLKVQAWFDVDNDGVIDLAEKRTQEQTVVLYNAANLKTVTTLTTAAFAKTSTGLTAKVAFTPAINTVQSASYFGVQYYARNAIVATAASSANAAGTGLTSSSGTLATTTADPGVAVNAQAGLGNFTARAFLSKNADAVLDATDVLLGSESATVTLFDGVDTTVNGAYVYSKSAADVKYTDTADADTANVVAVRSGTKTVSLTAQVTKEDGGNLATDGIDAETILDNNYKGANVLVKVVVTATALKTGNTITVNGGDATIAAIGDASTSYLRTDADGKVAITLTSSAGSDLDAVTVAVSALNSSDAWVTGSANAGVKENADAPTASVTWAKAVVSKFDVSPAKNVSGDNVALTFYVQDQFGEGLSATADGALKVYAVAEVAGVEKLTLLEKTLDVVAGKAAVSTANFAVKGGSAVVKGYLYVDGLTTKKAGSFTNPSVSNVVSVNLFNNNATGFISVSSSYSGAITYGDYVVGDKAVSATFLTNNQLGSATASITGSVQDANGGAQAASQVTVSGTGLLFVANGTSSASAIYAKDSVTFYTDAQGGFTFDVYAQKVSATGHTITITSGGKSVTTLLKTYLPNTLTQDNLKFSWNLPAYVVKNTTYVVTANVTDKWGNAIKGASIDFSAAGSSQVNGAASVSNKITDKTGATTVYLRSVMDIAGPGSLTATLDLTGWAHLTGTAGTAATGLTITSTATENAYTAWTEADWSNELTQDVIILDAAPKATITKAATSKVLVKNAAGTTVKVVRGTKSVTKTVTSNSTTISVKGGTGKVKVYVNGKLLTSK